MDFGEGFEVIIRARDISGYPPYKQIIPGPPTTPAPESYRFDASYLAAIDEVNREHPDYNGLNAVRCLAWSAIDDLGFTGPMSFEGVGGMTFIVMPMKEPRKAER